MMGSIVRKMKRSRLGVEEVVRTRKLELLNKNGKTRARLAMVSDGEAEAPVLSFIDPKSKTRLLAGISLAGAPLVCFSDTARKTRFVVALDGENRPHVGFCDEKGKTRFSLGWSSDQEWGLLVPDPADGKACWAKIVHEQPTSPETT